MLRRIGSLRPWPRSNWPWLLCPSVVCSCVSYQETPRLVTGLDDLLLWHRRGQCRASWAGRCAFCGLIIVSGPMGFPNDDSQEGWLPGQNKTGNAPFTFPAFLWTISWEHYAFFLHTTHFTGQNLKNIVFSIKGEKMSGVPIRLVVCINHCWHCKQLFIEPSITHQVLCSVLLMECLIEFPQQSYELGLIFLSIL